MKLSVATTLDQKYVAEKNRIFKAMSDQNRVKQLAGRKFHRVKQGQNRAKSGRSSKEVSTGLNLVVPAIIGIRWASNGFQ
jgi:hypothetical protein